jgi:hypothetical protein
MEPLTRRRPLLRAVRERCRAIQRSRLIPIRTQRPRVARVARERRVPLDPVVLPKS